MKITGDDLYEGGAGMTRGERLLILMAVAMLTALATFMATVAGT